MNVSFEEIGSLQVTFPAGTCADSKLCKLNVSGKADLCADGDRFCGLVRGIRGSAAGVQIHGFVTVPYTGSAPKCGYSKLSANAAGGVKADESGTAYLVAAVNTSGKTVTFEL